MKYICFTLFQILLLINNVYPQNSVFLARIDNKVVTVDEFRKRFELSPRITKSSDYEEKYDFLNSIVSEKLWAIAAMENNLDNNEAFILALENIKRMLARDMLFAREISDKVTISDSLLNSAKLKSLYTLHVKFLFAKTKEGIDSLFASLNSGDNFDSLLVNRPEYAEQRTQIEVKFDQMKESEENILFGLQVGSYSVPVKVDLGWVIYYLKEKDFIPSDKLISTNKVKEILELRERKIIGDRFLAKLFKNKTAKSNSEVLNKVIEKITSNERYIVETINDKGITENIFTPDNILKFYDSLSAEELGNTIIEIDGQIRELKEFLSWLSTETVKVKDKSENSIFQTLNGKLQKYFEYEILAQEAFTKGLQYSPEVLVELQTWQDNYLASYYKNQIARSVTVSNEEVEEILSQNLIGEKLSPKIRLQEIHSKNLDDIATIISRLSQGEIFENLYSERFPDKHAEEESLKYFYEFGKIGSVALEMNVGDIKGPISNEGGYSMIKLLEKREDASSPNIGLKEMQDLAHQKVYYEKLESILKENTIRLAEKYGVEINHNLLRDIPTNNINMVVYRKLGFGGQLLGAPYLENFSQWYKEWKEKQKLSL